MCLLSLTATVSAGPIQVVNQGPQSGPLTALHAGDLIQTPRGLAPLSLEGFSEDLDEDGFVDPIAAVEPVVAAAAPVAAVHYAADPAVQYAAAPVQSASAVQYASAPTVQYAPAVQYAAAPVQYAPSATVQYAAAPTTAVHYAAAPATAVQYAAAPATAVQYATAPFAAAQYAYTYPNLHAADATGKKILKIISNSVESDA